MWERFKSQFFGVQKKLDTADLQHQPNWPTEENEDFQALKAKWDEGEFDKEIVTYGAVSGLIDPLVEVLAQHESTWKEWIEKQRAAEQKKKRDEYRKKEVLKRRDRIWAIFTKRWGSLKARTHASVRPAPVWPKIDDDKYKALHQQLVDGVFDTEEVDALTDSDWKLIESLRMALIAQEAYITEHVAQVNEAVEAGGFAEHLFQFVMPLELQEAMANKGDALKQWVKSRPSVVDLPEDILAGRGGGGGGGLAYRREVSL